MFIPFLFIFVGFAYMFLIIHFASGWKRMKQIELLNSMPDLFISVLIPFKNERENLPALLEQLSVQTYPHFELIFIDDHSNDKGADLVSQSQKNVSNIILIKANGQGKKRALKQGVDIAKGDLIVTTDADCTPTKDWLLSLAQFQTKEMCDLIIGPVAMSYDTTTFSKLQALEFTSLVTSGAGAAAVNMPIMCNGANLAFTPQAFKKADLKEKESSGDDMFLLMSVKKQKGKIRFLKSSSAIVKTKPLNTIAEFAEQRKRWVSKGKSYSNISVLGTAFLVFFINGLMIVSLLVGIDDPIFLRTAILLFGIKTLVDASLIVPSADFFGVEKLTWMIPFLQIIYPFYVVYMTFVGILSKVRWK